MICVCGYEHDEDAPVDLEKLPNAGNHQFVCPPVAGTYACPVCGTMKFFQSEADFLKARIRKKQDTE